MSWKDGAEERAESLRRIRESAAQARYDFKRGWKIYRRSLLAVVGLINGHLDFGCINLCRRYRGRTPRKKFTGYQRCLAYRLRTKEGCPILRGM